MTIERRYQNRIQLAATVRLRYRGRTFEARVRDLSIDGIGLESGQMSLAGGTLLELEFDLAEERWQARGIVVYHRAPRFGLLFRNPQASLYAAAAGAAEPPPPTRAETTAQRPLRSI